jgi:hypothetical protein
MTNKINIKFAEAATHECVVAALDYDPATGVFRWKRTRGRMAKAGSQAGTIAPSGHRVIQINRICYKAHRLAVFYVTKCWPDRLLDHINMQPDDNRISNLRPADCCENNWNRRVQSNNISGHRGVYFSAGKGKWCAQIRYRKIYRYIGTFESKDAAISAYNTEAVRFFGAFCPKSISDSVGNNTSNQTIAAA